MRIIHSLGKNKLKFLISPVRIPFLLPFSLGIQLSYRPPLRLYPFMVVYQHQQWRCCFSVLVVAVVVVVMVVVRPLVQGTASGKKVPSEPYIFLTTGRGGGLLSKSQNQSLTLKKSSHPLLPPPRGEGRPKTQSLFSDQKFSKNKNKPLFWTLL